MTDEEIEAAVAADPDAPPLVDSDWFEGARLVVPETMELARLYVDKAVLAWFHTQEPELNWHINRVLGDYARAHGAGLAPIRGDDSPEPKNRSAA